MIDIEDESYQPEKGSSKVWLDMIAEAEKVFRPYNDRSDNIDKLYADLNWLSSLVRDRQYQLFWSNMQVMMPSIYSRPPVPVVVPRNKDRRPLYRVASEFLERTVAVGFELADINSAMLLVRDDLAILSRGAAWVRYVTGEKGNPNNERICIDHVERKDFLHEPARKWSEVGWVARRSWMTESELKARFEPKSGMAYLQATKKVQRQANRMGGATRQEKSPVWEIWSKTENAVVWVCEGVDIPLDEGKPHYDLEGFFPCPRPAYATIQRGGLIPVPDVMLYKDQLEEINALTNRIHALADAIKVRGFFPGGGDIGNAVEAALNINDDRKIMVPVANWAAFGGQGDQIIWLPIEVIANVVAGLVELRKSVIEDVYQIMGLSDIMRGATEKDETLGAQQLKAQFGSIRIREKQAELVRVARDCVRIAAEIMAEHFDKQTMLDMSQMDIPTDADIAKQLKGIEQQAASINAAMQQAQTNPQIMAQAQENPEQAEQMMQQAQGELQQLQQQAAKLEQTVTIEQVMKFLKDNRLRPFVLDIETDSTIQADEQSEKESRREFMDALAGMIAQFGPLLQTNPEMAPMVGEIIKFGLAPYRVGRELEGKIEEAIEQMVSKGQQPQANPEAERAKADAEVMQQQMQMDMQKMQVEMQMRQQEAQMKAQIEQAKIQGDMELKAREAELKQQEMAAKMQQIDAQTRRDETKSALELRKMEMEIAMKQQEFEIKARSAEIDASMKQQSADIQADQANRQAQIDAQASFGGDA